MSQDDFIITTYLLVDKFYRQVVTTKLRKKGFEPALSDVEIITIQIVGEFMGLNDDKKIWYFFKNNLSDWFPKLGSYANFCKHCANLWQVHHKITQSLVVQYNTDRQYSIDGFPIPVCRYARAHRHRRFKADAAFGYCASKAERYYGFKGHIVINATGLITNLTFAAANVDERDMVAEITDNIKGLLIGDKGYIRPDLKEELASRDIDLQTPLRKNMADVRSKEWVQWLCKKRRKVETVISQLTERFKINAVKVKDLWHLSHRVICQLAGKPSLQLEWIQES
ncbi:IS982 family transposase [Paralysiella testudinis]|uniref:IS982 family transposase n=1 Tax=Paralysiella testudinis TaxID=2809020 RepID=A0A892ZHM6_9NEIS|nr:IS982 family transposase [Paralysiella testudinis]